MERERTRERSAKERTSEDVGANAAKDKHLAGGFSRGPRRLRGVLILKSWARGEREREQERRQKGRENEEVLCVYRRAGLRVESRAQKAPPHFRVRKRLAGTNGLAHALAAVGLALTDRHSHRQMQQL